MEGTLRRAANIGGLVLVVAAAVASALGAPYAVAAALAVSGVALILGAGALLAQSAGKALVALAGAPVVTETDEDGAPWMKELGFFDFARQPIRRLHRKTVTLDGGTVTLTDFRVGAGSRPAHLHAAVFTVPCGASGALTLTRKGFAQSLRAKMLGGAVETGTALDETFVVYGDDAGDAKSAAVALDGRAIAELFRRATSLGAGADTAFAVANGRASLLAEDAPAGLFSPETAREILQRLATCARR